MLLCWPFFIRSRGSCFGVGAQEFDKTSPPQQAQQSCLRVRVLPVTESELRPGNINVSGFAQRAHINGALIRLLLGDGAQSPPPPGGMVQPAFNIVVNLANPALPDNSSTLVVFGVKFDTWTFDLPEDDFVMESVTFKALRVASEETGG